MGIAFNMLSYIFALISIIVANKSEPICEERSYGNSTAGGKELFCKQIPPTNTLGNVITLQVNGDINEIKDQLKAPRLQIEKLNLSHCGIFEIKPNAFATMNKLTILDLSHNKIELLTEDTFRNLSSLELLSLEGNGIKVIIEGALTYLKGLLELNLADNHLLEIPNDLPPLIRDLNLLNNEIERFSLDIINGLINLQILNLCGNEISTWPIGNYLSQLKKLCIGERVVSSEGKFWNNTAVTDLHISSSHLNHTYLNVNIKDTIGSLHNLHSLFIENYEINSFEFLKSTIHLKSLTLENIGLKENGIADFPLNLRKLIINESPELARKILDGGPFQQLEYLDLKNNALENITSKQNEKLLMTVKHLDISFNPLNCMAENWSWMLEKLKMKKNFLINKNYTTCSEPPAAKGLTLFEILYETVRSSEQPHNITGVNITKGHFGEENSFNISDVLKGVSIHVLFVIGVLAISAIFTLCLRLGKKFCRNSTQDINLQEMPNNPLQGTINTIHNNSDLGEQLNTSCSKKDAKPKTNYFKSDNNTKCTESFKMGDIEI